MPMRVQRREPGIKWEGIWHGDICNMVDIQVQGVCVGESG